MAVSAETLTDSSSGRLILSPKVIVPSDTATNSVSGTTFGTNSSLDTAETVPSDTATDSVSERLVPTATPTFPSETATDSVSAGITTVSGLLVNTIETVRSDTATYSVCAMITPVSVLLVNTV